MGKMYNMTRTSHQGVQYVETVELEELDEKKETLEDKFYHAINKKPSFCGTSTLAQIAKSHFQSHPEELGLVRIEDVLKVFDETRRSIFPEAFSSPVYLLCFTDAIKGMKGEGK